MARKLVLALLVVAGFASTSRANITFSVTFTANAQANLNASEQAQFTDGLNFWDNIIIGHRDGASRNWNLRVDVFSQPAGGGGVLLGSAGPSGVAFSGVVAGSHTSDNRFIISTGGNANFNIHPDAGPLSSDTIRHEIGHALGFGTLWEDNEVYNDGVNANSNRTLAGGTPGQYVGAAGLAAWRNEFVGQGGAAFVPVELAGGGGTAHGHWNESDDFGQTNTGIVDQMGRDMRFELMTGWAAPGTEFLSNTTVQQFHDIGFNVVPEPSSSILILVCCGTLGYRRSKRRA